MKEYLLTFNTQLDAVVARKKVKKMGGECHLCPVPRQLSSSCGTCAKITGIEKDALADFEFEKLFSVNGTEYIMERENE